MYDAALFAICVCQAVLRSHIDKRITRLCEDAASQKQVSVFVRTSSSSGAVVEATTVYAGMVVLSVEGSDWLTSWQARGSHIVLWYGPQMLSFVS